MRDAGVAEMCEPGIKGPLHQFPLPFHQFIPKATHETAFIRIPPHGRGSAGGGEFAGGRFASSVLKATRTESMGRRREASVRPNCPWLPGSAPSPPLAMLPSKSDVAVGEEGRGEGDEVELAVAPDRKSVV